MHHGTMIIKHFYAKALEEASVEGIAIDQQDFRYPGPKPDSKETAIVMLADAVEALSRLVNTRERSEIEDAVDQIVIDRLKDGQLSEAPLTMHDIDVIKESFVKTLLGSSHQRVRYMDVKEDAASSST
jgi:membrane-associated HD superfamily phosphohydrolase